MVVIAVVFPFVLLLAAVLIQLAANGVLRRNRVAGIRIRSTRSTDVGWVAGHKAAAPTVWIGLAISVAAGLGVLLLEGWVATALTVVVVVAVMATVAISSYLASRAARAASEPMLAGS